MIKYDDVWESDEYETDVFTMLYVQISCTATEDFLQRKMYWALACSSLGALMCLFFRFTMTYLSRIITIERKLLDYKLISIENYSVTGKISPELYH